MLTSLGKLSSHFNLDLKIPLNFRVDCCLTYDQNFRMDSLYQQPPSRGLPADSAWFCPLGWLLSSPITTRKSHFTTHFLMWMLTEQNTFQLNCKSHWSLPHSLLSWQFSVLTNKINCLLIELDTLVAINNSVNDVITKLYSSGSSSSIALHLSPCRGHFTCKRLIHCLIANCRVGRPTCQLSLSESDFTNPLPQVTRLGQWWVRFFASLWSLQVYFSALIKTLAQCCHDVQLIKENDRDCKPLNICVVRDALHIHCIVGKVKLSFLLRCCAFEKPVQIYSCTENYCSTWPETSQAEPVNKSGGIPNYLMWVSHTQDSLKVWPVQSCSHYLAVTTTRATSTVVDSCKFFSRNEYQLFKSKACAFLRSSWFTV